jgi:FixJ family two-component response regulator
MAREPRAVTGHLIDAGKDMAIAERQTANVPPLRHVPRRVDRLANEQGSGTDVAPLIFIVDDDSSVRNSLSRLFRSVGLRVELFESASQLLGHQGDARPHCLVLDVRLPGLSGLDLQGQLLKKNVSTPIIFMTGHGDVPMTVRAMKAGAVDFLPKPFRDQDMLDAVTAAVQRDKEARQADEAAAKLRAAYELLSAREREVMALVTSGLLNKQVAARLGLSEITVKIHRRNVMLKVKARSLPDLVRMAESLQIHKAPDLI